MIQFLEILLIVAVACLIALVIFITCKRFDKKIRYTTFDWAPYRHTSLRRVAPEYYNAFPTRLDGHDCRIVTMSTCTVAFNPIEYSEEYCYYVINKSRTYQGIVKISKVKALMNMHISFGDFLKLTDYALVTVGSRDRVILKKDQDRFIETFIANNMSALRIPMREAIACRY